MPEVPQYGGPQVRTAPLATPQQNIGIASPDAFGAGIAEGFSRGHIAVARANRDAKDQVVQTDVLANLTKWIKADDEARNGENGFMLREGDKARESVKEYGEFNAKLTDELSSQIKDPETQQAFKEAVQRRFQANESNLVSRTGQVLHQYTQDTMAASVEMDRAAAVKNFSIARATKDPEQIDAAYNELQQSIDAQRKTVRHLWQDIKGASPDVAAAEEQKAVDATALMATQSMLNRGEYKAADAYFQQVSPQMSEQARLHAEPQVKAGVDRQFEMENGQTIAAEKDKEGNPLNEREIRKRSEELSKDRPDLTEGVYNRAIQSRNQDLAAKSQEQSEVYDSKYKMLNDGLSYDQAVTVSDEAKMTPEQVRSLRSIGGIGKDLSREQSLAATIQHFGAMIAIENGSFVEHDEKGKAIAEKPVNASWIYSQAVENGWTKPMLDEALAKYKDRNTKQEVTYNQIENVLKRGGHSLEDAIKISPDFVNQVNGMLPAGKKPTDVDVQNALTKLYAQGEADIGKMSMGLGSNMTYAEAVTRGVADKWVAFATPEQIAAEEAKLGAAQNALMLKGIKARLIDANQVVARRLHQYRPVSEGGLGLPTPYAVDGTQMSVDQAAYDGIITGSKTKKKEILAPPVATPPYTSPGEAHKKAWQRTKF